MSDGASSWRIGPDRVIDLGFSRLMGILNVTPDSFSDGGRFTDVESAVAHAAEMIDGGAAMIDVGGESTRPGAARVSVAEQIDRVVPVIQAIRARWDIPLSIDTTRAPVAAAALDAGADVINDVAAGLEDEGMLPLAAARGCGIVLMHRLHPPDEDTWSDQWTRDPDYGGDVVASVCAWLLDRVSAARRAGVGDECICIDPGLGFGKGVAQNWALIAATSVFVATGCPVLGAASRKSCIGAVTGVTEPADRLAGSLAVTAMQHAAGIRLFRVHDVEDQGRLLVALEPRRSAAV